MHRPGIGEYVKSNKEESREIWDLCAFLSLCAVTVLLYNCVATAMWLTNGSMATTRWERSTATNLWYPKNAAFLVEEENCAPRGEICRLREAHLQRTQSRNGPLRESGNGRENEDHDRTRHEYRGVDSGTELPGWLQERDGNSGCGIVIKAVGRGKWVTISKCAVPLKVCTAMVAEIAGVTNECINMILKDTATRDYERSLR